MKKKTERDFDDDDMRPEYDFSKMKMVGRGIYAEQFRAGTNVVLLDRDVREAFPNDRDVNEALRVIAKAAKQQAARARKVQARSRKSSSRVRRKTA
jgi:3-hydroxyacyl-CoA dehydrogenase